MPYEDKEFPMFISGKLNTFWDNPKELKEVFLRKIKTDYSINDPERKKFVDAISIAYFSYVFWYELEKTIELKSNARAAYLSPLLSTALADAAGYIIGNNQIMSAEESFCAADIDCHNFYLAWAYCSGINNSIIDSGSFGTSGYSIMPVFFSSNECLGN